MSKPQFLYIHESHLDLFWIGDYRYCLERGRHVIKEYLDRCVERPGETFLLETVVFLEHFLKCHPDYEETVRKLWADGKLDIGAAYVDILEHLVPAESQVRNIVRGRRWCAEHLDIDTRLAAHADLPSLIPQVGQIYSQAGIRCYSTSRKVFPTGQVWVHVSPDGTGLLVFSHPAHYDFHELRRGAAALNEGRGWATYLDPDEALKGFPLGKVILSAGAADQADMACFVKRHGREPEDFIEDYRQGFPDYDFGFGTVSGMAGAYLGQEDMLPHLGGEIPSVWGMTSVPSSFFQENRRLEGVLLTAELLAAVQRWHGLPTVAETRDEWSGTLYERLYFLGKDPIPRGAELDELWKMHIFVCDHNFSGNYAPQTAFDKQTIQERALRYAGEMVAHGLAVMTGCVADPGADGFVLFNPLNWERTEPVEVNVPAEAVKAGAALSDDVGRPVPWQALDETDGEDGRTRIAILPTVPPASWIEVRPAAESAGAAPAAVQVRQAGGVVSIETDALGVAIDEETGAMVELRDKRTGADWGSPEVARLYAAYEEKFDVPLGVDESKVLAEEHMLGAEVTAQGPLFARVTLTKSILHAHVRQDVTLWREPVNAVDIRTEVLWHGQRRVQMRQVLPSAASRDDVWYGTPFCGNNWNNVVPGSGPQNPDEMASREHWKDYRELQLWILQRRPAGSLVLSSLHPTYHWGRHGLEAVLMRTTPSCADDRFFWEHAGRREYSFRLRFAEGDCPLSVAARAGQQEMVPIAVLNASPGGPAAVPPREPIVELEGDGLILSAIKPADRREGTVVRFFEAAGACTRATVAVAGAQRIERVDLLEDPLEALPAEGGTAVLDVRPYEIVTLRATRSAD